VSRRATKAELKEAFEACILHIQDVLLQAVRDDNGHCVSPSVVILLAEEPPKSAFEGLPLDFLPAAAPNDSNPVRFLLLVRSALTSPEGEYIPLDEFWELVDYLAERTNPYGIVTGMEAWTADVSPEEQLPASLQDYEKRQEAVIVTAEREGEYRLYRAPMQRGPNNLLKIDPWELLTNQAAGRIFRRIPANMKDWA
jgi:hypothetical protein